MIIVVIFITDVVGKIYSLPKRCIVNLSILGLTLTLQSSHVIDK